MPTENTWNTTTILASCKKQTTISLKSHSPAHQQYREPTPAVPSDNEDEAENAFSTITSESRSLAEALKHPDAKEWRRAAMEELQAHELNGTWKLIELPAGKKAIGLKWVFRLKHNADGSIGCYKGRLVAKGYNQ